MSEQQNNFDYERAFHTLDIRMKHIEKLVSELIYLAQCQTATFDHLFTEEEKLEHKNSLYLWGIE